MLLRGCVEFRVPKLTQLHSITNQQMDNMLSFTSSQAVNDASKEEIDDSELLQF